MDLQHCPRTAQRHLPGRRARHTRVMSEKAFPIPDVLKSYSALDKLTWLYVREHPGKLYVQDLVDAYGHHYQTFSESLQLLRQVGLIVTVREGGMVGRGGREAGEYRVATGDELSSVPTYTPAMKPRRAAKRPEDKASSDTGAAPGRGRRKATPDLQ
ncbi:hypothetical protein GCM10008959_23730 [Deinococcus seoulensis]|uniref:ArsR family transcriptional regulator n=2 Tax=Deinococcus seoulensis TaxID=1837379 RepID=A0ABQ2RSG0_9DEIO|nr:hypothetical protein GCM10008959_23730 [Deinococcus seoulensis]